MLPGHTSRQQARVDVWGSGVRDHRVERTGVESPDSSLLNQRPVLSLLPQQLRKFTTETLQVKPVRAFNPHTALAALSVTDNKSVIAVDIGGDKITASFFTITDDAIQRTLEVLNRQSYGGAGYLSALLEVRGIALREKVPVGVSFAGPTMGTRLIAGPNLPVFISEFQDAYNGDFANLFQMVEVANDAEAGILAGAVEAVRCYPDTRDVIYIINGSGLGGSVLTEDTIYAAEPGHIEVVGELNPFCQRKRCGLGNAAHVCIEVVAASKAGVEDIWAQRTGDQISGHQIAVRYLSGDRLALDLYDNSAYITAHAIRGMAAALRLPGDPGRLVIVGHGGIFHVLGYGERVRATLEKDLGYAAPVLFTKDFSANTCLEGAAIAAAARIL
jgi:predicted NBD/HSP70 family sugar kinase